MAAHLARERRAYFLHLHLDERVAGLPQERRAAVARDPRLQVARRLDVVDHGRAGLAREHVGGEEHELPVRVDDVAVLGDDAEPVAVAVEREAELEPVRLDARDQVAEILGLRGVRVVVGERPVDLAIHFRYLATQAAEQSWRERSGDPAPAVDRDPQRPGEPDVADDAVEVRGRNVVRAIRARARSERTGLDARAQRLDVGARERLAGHDHLEPVVVGRVVAAGHHHAALRAEVMRGEVGHRGGDHPDVDDVRAGRADPVRERRRERPGRTAGRRGRRRACRGRAPARACRAPVRPRARLPASASCRRCRECRRP